jgi:hypothetical protein
MRGEPLFIEDQFSAVVFRKCSYKPSDKKILAMRERDGLKTTEQDQREYVVQVE